MSMNLFITYMFIRLILRHSEMEKREREEKESQRELDRLIQIEGRKLENDELWIYLNIARRVYGLKELSDEEIIEWSLICRWEDRRKI